MLGKFLGFFLNLLFLNLGFLSCRLKCAVYIAAFGRFLLFGGFFGLGLLGGRGGAVICINYLALFL